MGQAKLKRLRAVPTVYHHTSILRTHQIWSSGVIELEGRNPDVEHPKIGLIRGGSVVRRPMVDFPPLAWFTTRIDIPKCLLNTEMHFVDLKTGETLDKVKLGEKETCEIAMNRIAIGFQVSAVSVMPWPNHPGYRTKEGEKLNKDAKDWGDDPDDWWVSEAPVDIELVSEIWVQRSRKVLKLIRDDTHLDAVRFYGRMAKKCNVMVLPAWTPKEIVKAIDAR